MSILFLAVAAVLAMLKLYGLVALSWGVILFIGLFPSAFAVVTTLAITARVATRR